MKQIAALFLGLFAVCIAQAQHPAFPTSLPSQFISEIEANILNRGYTLQVTEYYDFPNDRSRIDTIRNGSRHVVVHDYVNQWTYRTNLDARTCMASNASARGNPFASVGGDGLAHLVSITDFFEIGKKYHDKYVGTAMVRGILCDQYQGSYYNTTRTGFFFNYTMQWYFAKRDNWTMPVGDISPGTAIPVRLDLVGVSNFSRGPPRGAGAPPTGVPPTTAPPPSTPVHQFHHIYDFVNFRVGSLAALTPDLFNPPALVYCTGLPVDKDLPTLPSQFAFSTTVTTPANSTTFSTLYAYDAVRQETAAIYDFESTTNLPSYVLGQHRVIHNFREGTQYNITHTTCTMENLSAVVYAQDIQAIGGHARLVSANAVFSFLPKYNFTYQGYRTIRGIAAESWVAVRTDIPLVPGFPLNQSSLWEYYFSLPVWKFNSFTGFVNNTRVVLGARGRSMIPGYEDTFTLQYSVSNQEVGPPSGFFFDDSRCFSAAQQETITFVLDTSFDNYAALRTSIRTQLSFTMNVTSDRFHQDVYPAQDQKLTVLIRVHDIPTVGDPSLLSKLTTRATAVKNLRDSVRRGRFAVSGTGVAQARALSGSLSSSTDSPKTTFTPAEMAGLAVGVLLVGLIIGAGAVYVYNRRRSGDVPYGKQ